MSLNANASGYEWTDEHEAHLQSVVRATSRQIEEKYKAGQRQHGGRLWAKRGMLAHVQAEVTDLNVYLKTLHRQLQKALTMMVDGQHDVGAQMLADILGEAEE